MKLSTVGCALVMAALVPPTAIVSSYCAWVAITDPESSGHLRSGVTAVSRSVVAFAVAYRNAGIRSADARPTSGRGAYPITEPPSADDDGGRRGSPFE